MWSINAAMLRSIAIALSAIAAAAAAQPSVTGPDRMTGLVLHDAKEREFLKAVLQSMNLRYTVEATAGGEMVQWPSNDPALEQEIQNRVSQFWFISTQCPRMPLPSPSQPARERLSC